MSGVFIASLGHSGSTLLDLMLGSHPRLVSLGEIHATVTRFREPQNPCTCGAAAESCPVWGPVHETWRSAPDRPYAELHARVIERVRAVFGPEVAPVDSSKHLPALAALAAEQRRAQKVVFLVKDVRSYAASAVDRSLPWTLRHRNSTAWSVLRWWRGNRRIERYLAREALPHVTVGYEELCFRPRAVMRELCDFLGVDFRESMLAPQTGRAHVLRGNRMRFDRERSSELGYDARWMAGSRTLWSAPCLLPAMRLNRRLVYSRLAAPRPDAAQRTDGRSR